MEPRGQQPPALSTPLEGVTVLDLTVALAGPYATLLLAGLGATVIKVENPDRGGDTSRNNAPYVGAAGLSLAREGDQDLSVAMLERGRNKLSITLNLKHPRARELFGELVRHSDVVVENYPAGTADRLGVGYSFCSAVNERIVYTAISGFGATGARRAQKGMDTIFQAMSGLMTVSGSDGEPPVRSGIPVGDMTGPLFAVIGTLAALHQRERTGVGQFVDVSLLGTLTSVVATEPFDKLEGLGIPTRTGSSVPRLAPFGIFPTADGHIALCAPLDQMTRGVFAAMNKPELAEDERFWSRDRRVRNWRELHALIDAWAGARTTEEAVNLLQAAGAPAAPVRTPQEAVRDPELLARHETMQLVHPRFGPVDDLIGSGFPIGFSGAEVGYERPPPYLGEHNEVILGGMLGCDADEIAALRADGVI
ncbi:MAG TPA: CoA transferase [Solirubrobacteraceae bacterium]|nr:CoA transferase [Solirubrobacteraceae bacterium]